MAAGCEPADGKTARNRKGSVGAMQASSLSGVLLVDKPAGISSFGVIAQIRRILGIKKVGHCGTLDNFATGVLVVLLGRATRLARFVSVQDKRYQATILFGQKTDTADITGKVIAISDLPKGLSADLAEKVLGMTSQIPPIYSAIKVDGKRAYALARAGASPAMKPRAIKISNFTIKDFDGRLMSYEAKVSKGTYIRTLSQDISQLLGVVGTTQALRRVECAGFGIDDCVQIDQQTSGEFLRSRVLSADVLLQDFPALQIDDALFERFCHGNFWEEERAKNGFTKIYHNEEFVGVAWTEQGKVQPKIVF